MKQIVRSALVPFSSLQMFDLVNDIEQYPHFLPWCPQAQILSKTSDEIQATVHFAKGAFGKSFTTVNRLHPHQKVEMELVEGPFKHLSGTWEFENVEKGSKVTLNLSFEFSNALMALAVGPLFNQIASTLVDSFTARAQSVYA